MDNRCTLFVGDTAWCLACAWEDSVQVYEVDSPSGDVQSKAQRVADLMREYGLVGPVLLALPSRWCLSAELDTAGLSRSNRRQALRYLLEEEVPVSAEESVSDFLEHSAGMMGIAVVTYQIEPIIEALQSNDIAVKHICPAAVLAVVPLIKSYNSATAFLIESAAGLDLIAVERGNIVRWWWLPTVDGLREQVERFFAAGGEGLQLLVTLGISTARDVFSDIEVIDADEQDQDLIERSATHSALLLAGDEAPLIDFRRDALAAPDHFRQHHKYLGILAAALAFFLLSIMGATLWRSAQYRSHAQDVDLQLIELYKQAIPGERAPSTGMIVGRLKSEQRRLAGIGGATGSGGQTPGNTLQQTSALAQLHSVMTAWPSNLRYRISDLTIEPNLIRVNGQAVDTVTPEKLAASLRVTGTYEVDAANTRALRDYGYSFGFLARPVLSEAAEESAGASQ